MEAQQRDRILLLMLCQKPLVRSFFIIISLKKLPLRGSALFLLSELIFRVNISHIFKIFLKTTKNEKKTVY
jgi:hypothetical protein